MTLERKPSRDRFLLLDGETGKQYPLDYLPVEDGDLILIRNDPPLPADQSVQLREMVKEASGKTVLIGSGPASWEFTLMRRVEIESLLARLQEHLKATWREPDTHQ